MKRLKNAVNRIFKLSEYETVKYEDLQSAPAKIWIDLSTNLEATAESKVKYMRYPTKKTGQLVFITEIEKGHGYHYHMHDCKETITVMQGEVVLNDQKSLAQLSTETLHSGTAHKIIAKVKAQIFVEFIKV